MKVPEHSLSPTDEEITKLIVRLDAHRGAGAMISKPFDFLTGFAREVLATFTPPAPEVASEEVIEAATSLRDHARKLTAIDRWDSGGNHILIHADGMLDLEGLCNESDAALAKWGAARKEEK